LRGILHEVLPLFPSTPAQSLVSADSATLTTRKFIIRGMVQGVGFRPHLYRLARIHALGGRVANSLAGVELILAGSRAAMDQLIEELLHTPPPGALIASIEEEEIADRVYEGFTIAASLAAGTGTSLAPADFGMCATCEKELLDPANPRHRHPFISCTACGPRFSLLHGLPYDRAQTSMAPFPLCPLCRQEYTDPDSRRFHAEPICCPDCGPQLTLHHQKKNQTDKNGDRAAAILARGGLVAIKGVGGFHVAVDAADHKAVARLRRLKQRPDKPLAVMVRDLAGASTLAHMEPRAEALLTSPVRPIVIMPRKATAPLAALIAPGMTEIGIMLAYTPLHFLLFEQGPAALVMTSLNEPGSPMLTSSTAAVARFGHSCDAVLSHNRTIVSRCDDSVLRMHDEQAIPIRRSRGYAPLPLALPVSGPAILACGAGEKVTICLSRGANAFLSQHLGETASPAGRQGYTEACRHLQGLFKITPQVVAHDLHPDYFSSRFAADQTGCTRIGVQHHHAHIAACMAENNVRHAVLGLALDGTGLGDDNTLWGGEILHCTYRGYRRLAHLAPLAMPGGEAAIKEPWRLALAWLHEQGHDRHGFTFLRDIAEADQETLLHMVDGRLNTPLTSSLGRLFDAVAALINLRRRITFSGQAAMELEMISARDEEGHYPVRMTATAAGQPHVMETDQILAGLCGDIRAGVEQPVLAARFHNSVLRLLCDTVLRLAAEEEISEVACSGGVFQNRLISRGIQKNLGAAGLRVHIHQQVPCNDGGLALGQAAVAAALSGREDPHRQ